MMVQPQNAQPQNLQNSIQSTFLQASSNAYSFDYTTKDGDKLSFSMNSSAYTSTKENQNGSTHTLTQKFSYEMKYEGNGLSENDRKEIAAALEEAAPMMQEFMKATNEAKTNTLESFRSNVAQSLKDAFAPVQNPDNTEEIKSMTADKISKLLEEFDLRKQDSQKNMLEQASKLFEDIFDQDKKLNLYA